LDGSFVKKPPEVGLVNTFVVNPAPFPHRLEIGAEWSYAFEFTEEWKKKAKEGFLYIAIEDSSTRNINKAPKGLLVESKVD
jgi:hypothetical protein